MKSVDLYKIGKSQNVQERLKQFRTGNPYIEIIRTINGDHEDYLHELYKEKRKNGEWFSLQEEDIDNIDVEVYRRDSTNKPAKVRLKTSNTMCTQVGKNMIVYEWVVQLKSNSLTALNKMYIKQDIEIHKEIEGDIVEDNITIGKWKVI